MSKEADAALVEKLYKIDMTSLEEQVSDVFRDAEAQRELPTGLIRKENETTQEYLKRIFQEKIRGPVERIVCVDLKYCERIDSEPIKFILDVANAFVQAKITIAIGMPVPAVKFAVYMVRSRVLDPLCKC